MKTNTEIIAEQSAQIAALAADVEALKTALAVSEEDQKRLDEEQKKKDEAPAEDKPEEDSPAEDKPAEDPAPSDEEQKKLDDEEEMKKKEGMKALADEVKSLRAVMSAHGLIGKPGEQVPEGGQEGASSGSKMSSSEALAAYNKIDPNDAKGRAAFRRDHAEELGLK